LIVLQEFIIIRFVKNKKGNTLIKVTFTDRFSSGAISTKTWSQIYDIVFTEEGIIRFALYGKKDIVDPKKKNNPILES